MPHSFTIHLGSPPRMRGKVAFCVFFGYCTWITPAYAGKSESAGHHPGQHWDHPRVCGEKRCIIHIFHHYIGSPPRMRGKDTSKNPTDKGARITPAYAGKSATAAARRLGYGDHPRVCGEKPLLRYSGSAGQGSPPRMRGKELALDDPETGDRITPAYAGKRLKRSRSTVPPVAIVPLFPSVCNKPVVSDGSPAERDAPLFLPAENAAPASPAYNLRSL